MRLKHQFNHTLHLSQLKKRSGSWKFRIVVMASFTILCIVFCSLRVGYGSISSHSFTKDMYKRFTNVTYVLSTPSRIACCLACAEKPGCEAVSYSSRFQTCELAGTGSATESHLSWNLYKKTGKYNVNNHVHVFTCTYCA